MNGHDVFVVTSRSRGRRTDRVVVAGDEDDARATHETHYPCDMILRVAPRD